MNNGSDPDPDPPLFSASGVVLLENGCFEVAAGGIREGGVSVVVQMGEVAGEGDVLGGELELGSSALVRDLIPLPPHINHTWKKRVLINVSVSEQSF